MWKFQLSAKRARKAGAPLAADVFEASEVAVELAAVRAARFDETANLVGTIAHRRVADQCDHQSRALPGVVALSLGDRDAEAAAELLLQRLQMLALALQVLRLAEVEPGLDDADERSHRSRELGVERLLDLAGGEDLEDVADLDVGEPCEHDAALLALWHFFDVILEAAE